MLRWHETWSTKPPTISSKGGKVTLSSKEGMDLPKFEKEYDDE
jgi:hypothetical protein